MAVLGVLLVLVVLVVAIVVIRRRTRSTPAAPEPASASPPEPNTGAAAPPTFRVVTLGVSGSGKSVFLSTMFHALNYRDSGRSYHLEASPEQSVLLSSIYSQLSDPGRDWPSATFVAEGREFVFDVVTTDDRNDKRRPFRFTYFDYAGDLLEHRQQAGESALRELSDRVQNAQALLGLIDGYRVLQLLRNEPAGHHYFEHTLRPMLGMLENARAPIHLVLSKWDLVRDFGEPADADDQQRLDHVVDAIMSFDHVRSLVYYRSNQIVRLIPVSAVGRTFARLDDRGVVVKRPGGTIRPINVELPVCAVLPDLFRQIQVALDEVARAELEAEVRKRVQIGSVEWMSSAAAFFKRPTGAVLRTLVISYLGAPMANDIAGDFMAWAAKPYERQGERIAKIRNEKQAELARAQQARANVLADFEKSVYRLEAVLPNSNLSR